MDKEYISNNILKSAVMAIKAGSSALAKTTVSVLYKIAGVIYPVLAAADLPALTGQNVADGFTLALLVQVSTAGVVTYKASTAIANTALVGKIFNTADLPTQDIGNALVGYIVIKNASGSTFTGGTTALDASSVTVSYIDAFGYVGS